MQATRQIINYLINNLIKCKLSQPNHLFTVMLMVPWLIIWNGMSFVSIVSPSAAFCVTTFFVVFTVLPLLTTTLPCVIVVSKQCNGQKRVETSRKRVETSRNEQKRVGNEQKRIGNEQKFRKRVKLSTQQVLLSVLIFLHWGAASPKPPLSQCLSRHYYSVGDVSYRSSCIFSLFHI